MPKLNGIGGSIHGGQQPVAGATVQLYTVGTTGDGSAATPLLTATVKSDANGNFTFTGLYSCADATLVYLTATGGDPGLGASNPNLEMMTAIGNCSSMNSNTFLTINERTTVAAVSALAPFMGNSGSIVNVGSSTGDASALAAAFQLASELVDPGTGETPGNNVPAGMTVPAREINSLADLISTCVNSAGGTAGDSTVCGKIFSLTTPTNSSAPTNTVSALLSLANNPTLNTAALYNLIPAVAPFQPQLTMAPPDFQVRLVPPTSSMALQFNPASVTFPSTSVGFASTPVSVNITNTGLAAVTVSNVTFTGPSAVEFAQTNNCTVALLPTGSCTVQVTLTPSAIGTRNAYLSIASNTSASPQYVPLTGTGISPSAGPITLSSTALSFTLAGSSQDITLSNFGNTPLTIANITSSDPTFLQTNNCGTILPAQSICTISVQSIGLAYLGYCSCYVSYSGKLTINDDASTGPQIVQLNSTDTAGVTYTVVGYSHLNTFDLGSWGVGDTTTNSSFQYTVGTAYQTGYFSGTFTGPAANDFSTPGCTVGFMQGICYFTVTFKPSAPGIRVASLNGVKFTGTGLPPGPSFVIGSSTNLAPYLSNLNVASSSSTVMLTNNGTTQLNFSFAVSGANAGNFSLQSSGCTSLAPAASCSLNYGFSTNSVGTYSAVVTVTDSVSSISHSVPLSAQVSYWSPFAVPNSLQFGIQALGTSSASQVFTVSDGNSQPLGHPIRVTLQPSSDFTLPNGSDCTASATTSCVLSVAFSPHDTGSISETLTITDLTSGFTTGLTLSGTGGSSGVSLSSGSVVFPDRLVGTTSIPVAITVTNTGTAPLLVSQINITGAGAANFSATNGCGNVAPNATCPINITFAPVATGPLSATIQIVSNASSSPDHIDVSGTAH
jgi:hypothetical protein